MPARPSLSITPNPLPESHSPKSLDLDIVFRNEKDHKYSEGVRFEYKPGVSSNESLLKVIHDLEKKISKYGHAFGDAFNKYEHYIKYKYWHALVYQLLLSCNCPM